MQTINHLTLSVVENIADIAESEWQQCAEGALPFSDYRFLRALEETACVDKAAGWQAVHVVIKDEDTVVAILPLYVKGNSWGEYVHDWSWADAYGQHGIPYYPKLVTATPFSPVSGNKLLILPGYRSYSDELLMTVINFLSKQLNAFSGFHWLFSGGVETTFLSTQPLLKRQSVQFHWLNNEYSDFDDFLGSLKSRKRKAIQKERRSIAESELEIFELSGADIDSETLRVFFDCYENTYEVRGMPPHLTLAFFERLIQDMPEHIMMKVARKHGAIVAAAFFIHDKTTLYGRYWGALVDIPFLHFELCYYQGIEFAIKNKLSYFNPGTQGEHKIARGFSPVYCYSFHQIAHTGFRQAIEKFCADECDQVDQYYTNVQQLLPYKN